MQDRTPSPESLDPIERASVDELRALQLERLRWSRAARVRQRLRTTGAPSTATASTRPTSRSLADLAGCRSPPRPTCATTTRSACSRCRARRSSRVHASSGTTGKPTVVGYTADDIATWATRHGPLDPRVRWAPRAKRAHRLWLRPVHRRARSALRRRGARLHGDPGVRRDDRTAGDADPRLRAGRDHGDPVLHARDRRRDANGGYRPALTSLGGRDLRCRALDERHAARDWNTASTCTPSTSTACPR